MSAELHLADCSIRSRECEDVTVKVARSRAEFEGAFRLVYSSYLRAGLCSPSAQQTRVTPYHLLPSTDVIVGILRGEVISTLSLVRDGELGLPMESVYGDEVEKRRAAGLRLAEVSCLADRRKEPARFFGLFCDLSRVMVQMAAAEGIDQLLIAVHPRHARMYARAMAFQQFGEPREYPLVNGNAAVALTLDMEWARAHQAVLWRRFVGTALPERVIRSCPMSASDRRYFEALLLSSTDGSASRAVPRSMPDVFESYQQLGGLVAAR